MYDHVHVSSIDCLPYCMCMCSSLCVYGGGDRRQQIQGINKGVEIVIGKNRLYYCKRITLTLISFLCRVWRALIATPGRLNDLLMNGILTVNTVTYLVSCSILNNAT